MVFLSILFTAANVILAPLQSASPPSACYEMIVENRVPVQRFKVFYDADKFSVEMLGMQKKYPDMYLVCDQTSPVIVWSLLEDNIGAVSLGSLQYGAYQLVQKEGVQKAAQKYRLPPSMFNFKISNTRDMFMPSYLLKPINTESSLKLNKLRTRRICNQECLLYEDAKKTTKAWVDKKTTFILDYERTVRLTPSQPPITIGFRVTQLAYHKTGGIPLSRFQVPKGYTLRVPQTWRDLGVKPPTGVSFIYPTKPYDINGFDLLSNEASKMPTAPPHSLKP